MLSRRRLQFGKKSYAVPGVFAASLSSSQRSRLILRLNQSIVIKRPVRPGDRFDRLALRAPEIGKKWGDLSLSQVDQRHRDSCSRPQSRYYDELIRRKYRSLHVRPETNECGFFW
jgi:hypothetical protein